jgi:hypothetical protein
MEYFPVIATRAVPNNAAKNNDRNLANCSVAAHTIRAYEAPYEQTELPQLPPAFEEQAALPQVGVPPQPARLLT